MPVLASAPPTATAAATSDARQLPEWPTLRQAVEHGAWLLRDAGVAFGHGTDNAHDESAWLVLWAMGLALDTDLTANTPQARQRLTPDETQRVLDVLGERIRTRKPAAYLTHEAWLQGVPFYVDERAIVPRSFIGELLVHGDIDPWLHPHTDRVLDLCTGNGSLAVLAALTYPDITVDATDLSPEALVVAAINVQRHHLQSRIHLHTSDGLRQVPAQRYDLILCNPPYVNAQSMAALPAEYRAEPAMALDGNTAGGHDGMDFIRQLLHDAPNHLSEHGVLVLEIGNERAHFDAAFPRLEPVWLHTSAGEDQVLLLTAENLSASALHA